MNENNSKFVKKNGQLTMYAFACGYVEKGETSLYKDGCWHVRNYDEGIWETFNTHKEARKFFNQCHKKEKHTNQKSKNTCKR
jgi:hypothetical protein